MSIRDHKEEVKRWFDAPDGTKVWTSGIAADGWKLTDNPEWLAERIYIVDDKHAELRKQFVDDRSKIEYLYLNKEWKQTSAGTLREFTERLYESENEYRIKPKEWYENIPFGGVWCWVWDDENSEGKRIYKICKFDEEEETYKFLGCNGTYWKHAQLLDPQPKFKE